MPDELAQVLEGWVTRLTLIHAPAVSCTVFGHAVIEDGEALRCDILAVDRFALDHGPAGFHRLGRQAAAPATRR